MRNALFTVGALLALVAPVRGGVARTGMPGKIILENTGLEIRPRIFLPGWKGVGAEGGRPKGGALAFGFGLARPRLQDERRSSPQAMETSRPDGF